MGRNSNFERNASKPLLGSDSATEDVSSVKQVQLFDETSMLEMKKSLCEGYITLLSGGGALILEQPRPQKKSKKGRTKKESRHNDPAVVLAFAALTTGNVIDACFGISMSSKHQKNISHVLQRIKDVKNALYDVNDKNHRACAVAVAAYQSAFGTIVEMHNKLDKLGFFSKCFKEGKIRKNAGKKLHSDFLPLERILADSK